MLGALPIAIERLFSKLSELVANFCCQLGTPRQCSHAVISGKNESRYWIERLSSAAFAPD